MKKDENEIVSRQVITNYYTGEKWFLVGVDGEERYMSESKYKELLGKEINNRELK